MINGGIFLQAFTNFGEVFAAWEELGFFSYLLPFLLIFALVFGVLSKVRIFGTNKGISVIIAFVVALMSLQFPMVSQFFSAIFPRISIGLVIILGILIIVGLFADPESNVINYILLGISAIVLIIVLVQTAGSVGLQSGQWWSNNWPMIAAIVVILVFVIIIVSAGSGGKAPDYRGPWARDWFGLKK